MMTDLVPYLIGAGLMLLSNRLGVKIPLLPEPAIPSPSPSPASPDSVLKGAAELLAWVLKVKAGVVRLDDHDKETMKLIAAALREMHPQA